MAQEWDFLKGGGGGLALFIFNFFSRFIILAFRNDFAKLCYACDDKP